MNTINATKFIFQITIFTLIIFLSVTFISARFSVLGFRSFSVASGSMEPKIHVGSVTFAKPVNEYKVGNIVTFNRNGLFVTHRIADLRNGGFVTKGDANKSPDDQMIYKNVIVGKNVFTIPYLGKFINSLNTSLGFVVFILSPVIICLIFEIIFLKKSLNNKLDKNKINLNHL